jgi:hypothetical protein
VRQVCEFEAASMAFSSVVSMTLLKGVSPPAWTRCSHVRTAASEGGRSPRAAPEFAQSVVEIVLFVISTTPFLEAPLRRFQIQPSSFIASPAFQIFCMCRILSPSKYMTYT